jgi:hypothetical protein
LEKYDQVPLRRLLTKKVRSSEEPLVVDAIRNVGDVEEKSLGDRPLLTWFVESSEVIIAARLAKKTKLGEARLQGANTIDRTVPAIRAHSHRVIPNNGTLEELRWGLDDSLFSALRLMKEN